ncbi:MAG TPA: hypothetical protein VN734_08895 [Acidobacteriaceae bacterium]|nr:hypothetical protein [Acidobacteriaceae bacterium]
MMKLWCWRCKSEMPMLDAHEYGQIAALYEAGIRAAVKNISRDERFAPVLARYQELTGYSETNPNAVMHHRLSLYGPPCSNCGKPLRTPQAKLCGSCMAPRSP